VNTGTGATYVLYDGTAEVSGRVAMVGEGVIEATATRLFGRFFDCVASHVEPSE
jgi:carbon monoxide dehydrogenase subunit G